MKELLYGIEKLYPFRMRLNIDDATPQGIYIINSAYVYLEISVPTPIVVDPDEPVDPDIPIDLPPSTWEKPTARKIVMNFGANNRSWLDTYIIPNTWYYVSSANSRGGAITLNKRFEANGIFTFEQIDTTVGRYKMEPRITEVDEYNFYQIGFNIG
nr:MAG TPA: hypothetical protein [Caudoviricetes sp.]